MQLLLPHSHLIRPHAIRTAIGRAFCHGLCGTLLSVMAVMMPWSLLHAEPTREDRDFYEQQIRPVLVDHCYGCHSAEAKEVKAGLRLDGADGWLKGGDSGPAVAPNQPDQSLLLRALRYEEDVAQMPPDMPLPADVVARFRIWIEHGAIGPTIEDAPSHSPANTPHVQAVLAPHWAFQAPVAADLPDGSLVTAGRATTRLDRLIEAKLLKAGIPSAPPADRRTLIRRLYFDLIGLPPSYDQSSAFVAAASETAYEELVERLLASPRFGERWGRLWLDVARFADTKGYVFTEDRNYPEAFRYRDWVIAAFNSDRPFADFIKCQLAADQVHPDQPADLAAMGFLTLGRRFLNNIHDIIDDRIDVTTRGLMGLTVTCARCHDHKFDPIPSEDYYSLYGVFASSQEPGGEPSSLRMIDKPEPTTPVVFLRGQPGRNGPQVPRRFLKALSGEDRQPFPHGSGRVDMAEAIAAPQNPLTARVFVNRVWGRLFGSYLVDTPSDFGTRTARPIHADVLDDLTVGFLRSEGSLKWLVREIVLSASYRQSSDLSAVGDSGDSANQLYWRMNRRRLDFEGWRDAMLSVSGTLDSNTIGGPSVEIANESPSRRRTLYAHIDRQNVPSLFRAFDLASSDSHAPKRYETTVPQQALYLMNHPFSLDLAAATAQATYAADHDTVSSRAHRLYRRVLGRDPDENEIRRVVSFLRAPGQAATSAEVSDRWNDLTQALLMSNEFLFLD